VIYPVQLKGFSCELACAKSAVTSRKQKYNEVKNDCKIIPGDETTQSE
jgi:hypothetical protein